MQMLGPYQIIKSLGEGGMGQVYLASLIKDGGFEKWLALKTIKAELAKEEHFLNLFEKEARMAAMLNHQNIVQIFDFGYDQTGGAYLAMEYIKGLDLREILQKTKIPMDVTLEVMMACAKALDYASRFKSLNQVGLIHRDISPHNILLGFEGEIKLIDFGLVQFKDSIQGNVEGKMGYMSPEQAYNLPLSPSSDLFSLGIVFYECLSGHRVYPHLGYTIEEALSVQQKAQIKPIETLNPQLDESIVQLLHKLLAPEPLDRFQNASDLYEELKNIAKKLNIFIGGNSENWLKNHFNQRYMAQTESLKSAESTLSLLQTQDHSISTTSIISKLQKPSEYTYSAVDLDHSISTQAHTETVDLPVKQVMPQREDQQGTQSTTYPINQVIESAEPTEPTEPNTPISINQPNIPQQKYHLIFILILFILGVYWFLEQQHTDEIPTIDLAINKTSLIDQAIIDQAIIDQAIIDQAIIDQSIIDQGIKPKVKIKKNENKISPIPMLFINLNGKKIALKENELHSISLLGESVNFKWKKNDQNTLLTIHGNHLQYRLNQGPMKEFPATLKLNHKNELLIQKDSQSMIKLNIESSF